jgi:hypothetical protein
MGNSDGLKAARSKGKSSLFHASFLRPYCLSLKAKSLVGGKPLLASLVLEALGEQGSSVLAPWPTKLLAVDGDQLLQTHDKGEKTVC